MNYLETVRKIKDLQEAIEDLHKRKRTPAEDDTLIDMEMEAQRLRMALRVSEAEEQWQAKVNKVADRLSTLTETNLEIVGLMIDSLLKRQRGGRNGEKST